MDNYSVLMSVYKGENAEDFTAAIQSMLDQTVVTDDFVIVCDGPLTGELDAVVESYAARYPALFQIVRLPVNVGVGMASNAGLKVCRNELIAKMDSDDISVPDRCEKQLVRFAARPELTILGGFIEEFDNQTGKGLSLRTVPLDNEGIRKYARRRSPVNNVTAMYKKSAVESVGGYRNLRRAEDYDLCLRLLIGGYHAENLPDILVLVRVDLNTQRRRASWHSVRGGFAAHWNAYRMGFASLTDLIVWLGGKMFLLICPGSVQQMLYQKFLRKKIG